MELAEEKHLWCHWNKGFPHLPFRVSPIHRLPFSIRSMASTVQLCTPVTRVRGAPKCCHKQGYADLGALTSPQIVP